MKEIRILMLEDIADDAGLISRILKKENMMFVSERVDTQEEFVRGLLEFKPDVILSDHGLPQFNSIEALRLCREHEITGPFILVTGTVSEEFAVNCLKQGADDYVLKSNLSRLPTAIINAMNQREAEQMKRMAEEKLLAQNKALTKANAELLKSNSELDKFVYSVSHNLKAPLASVLGLVSIAKMEDENKYNEFGTYLDMIKKSINRLNDTLEDILDYSHNARGEINIESIDLKSLLEECLEKLKFMERATQIKFSIEVEGSAPFCSDRHRVGIILHNLLSNAIKYSDKAKENCEVSVNISISSNAVIRVEDNGIGIKPDVVEKIFNMFYRGSEKSDGAGLGLYIAQEAITRLDGKISVESTPGVGTVFHIILPNEHKDQ